MTIHFICKGNTFRSRLAEAYLNSKQIPNLKVISSGIEAELNESGPVTWHTQRIIQQNKLVPFEKPTWEQTTKALLEKGDLTIFTRQSIYDYCIEHFGFNGKNFQIWDIHDAGETVNNWDSLNEEEQIKVTEKIFKEIQQKVDELIKNL